MAMSVVGRGVGNRARMPAPALKDAFDPSIVCSSVAVTIHQAFGDLGYNHRYEIQYSVVQSAKWVHAVVVCKTSMEPPSVGSVAFRYSQRPGAASIDPVCFPRRNSIDLLCHETCAWFQQAIPLSSVAISKSPRLLFGSASS